MTLPDSALEYCLIAGLNVRPGDVLDTPHGKLKIRKLEGIWAAVEPVPEGDE